jgi:electron transport complex protein RnfD
MKFPQPSSPHWLGTLTVPAMMQHVLWALLPVILVSSWLLGTGVLVNCAFALVCCITLEALALLARNKPLRPFVTDGSALITALLIALALPPLTPWWITAIACLFAIVFAKHLYGGLGQNPFNPAMVGYVVVLVSFPEQLARWPGLHAPDASLLTILNVFLYGQTDSTTAIDALSGATPLDDIKIQLAQMRIMGEIVTRENYGWLAGRDWQWINLAALAGGVWLLYRRIIRWHIPAAMLMSMALLYGVFYLGDASTNPSALTGLFSGGTMVAVFFVATDPVSAATSDRGKLIYGAGIGILCFAVRKWGAYPDGIGFAILLMNMSAPLIDRYTLPRVYGHRKRP